MFPASLLYIFIVLLIGGLIYWLVGYIPDATAVRVLRVVLIVFGVICLIVLLIELLGGVGGGRPLFRLG
jgi:hypothetical protein